MSGMAGCIAAFESVTKGRFGPFATHLSNQPRHNFFARDNQLLCFATGFTFGNRVGESHLIDVEGREYLSDFGGVVDRLGRVYFELSSNHPIRESYPACYHMLSDANRKLTNNTL